LDKRVKNGRNEYKIKWVGYSLSDCTWEPESNLNYCRDMVKAFNSKLKPSIAPTIDTEKP
jgi:hypothetical protein